MAEGIEPAILQAAMRAQGFLLLTSVFDKELMDDLRVSLDQARKREETRFGLAALEQIGQDGYVSDLLAIGPAIETLLESDILDHVLRTFFDNEARLYVGQGIILDPGKGRGVWPRCWHADMFQIGQAIGDPAFCYGINCLVIVDDMNEANGPTCLLAGSQSLKQMGTDSEEDFASVEVRTVAPSGSLLLIGASTWHSAGRNNSVKPRRVIKLLFTRQWIRPQIDYAAVISADVAGRLGPHARHLLGLP